jgi:hypothetical protein
MPSPDDLPHQRSVPRRALADDKEGGPRTAGVEDVEDPRRHLGVRPVVEGDCDAAHAGPREARQVAPEHPAARMHAAGEKHVIAGERAEQLRPRRRLRGQPRRAQPVKAERRAHDRGGRPAPRHPPTPAARSRFQASARPWPHHRKAEITFCPRPCRAPGEALTRQAPAKRRIRFAPEERRATPEWLRPSFPGSGHAPESRVAAWTRLMLCGNEARPAGGLRGLVAVTGPATHTRTRLRTHCPSQKVTAAARVMALKKVWAQRS